MRFCVYMKKCIASSSNKIFYIQKTIFYSANNAESNAVLHDTIACSSIFIWPTRKLLLPRQQNFRGMNGAHSASPIRGELGYAHWPQLGTQFIALLGTKFGPFRANTL